MYEKQTVFISGNIFISDVMVEGDIIMLSNMEKDFWKILNKWFNTKTRPKKDISVYDNDNLITHYNSCKIIEFDNGIHYIKYKSDESYKVNSDFLRLIKIKKIKKEKIKFNDELKKEIKFKDEKED